MAYQGVGPADALKKAGAYVMYGEQLREPQTRAQSGKTNLLGLATEVCRMPHGEGNGRESTGTDRPVGNLSQAAATFRGKERTQ